MKITTITIPGIANTRTEDGYYQFNIFTRDKVVATDGVMEFAETHGAHWLLDVIASYLPKAQKMQADYMLIAEVVVNKAKNSCVFTLKDDFNGTGELRTIAKQNIEYTDLTVDTKMWVICESPNKKFSFAYRSVLMLPSEY